MDTTFPTRALGPRLQTTVVGFGGGAISGEGGGYGFGHVSETEAQDLLAAAWDVGVRLFDTAPIYGFGLSEERIGRYLAANPSRRDEMILVSKLGVTWDDAKRVYTSNAPEVARRMLEESLARLRTDHIDVYFVHWPDPDTPVERTMEVLAKAHEKGTIRAIGVSNFDAAQLERARAVAPVEVLQNRFCLLEGSPRQALFPAARKSGLGFMAYGPLAKGLLSGSVSPGRTFDEVDFRGRGTQIFRQYEASATALERVRVLARELGVTMTQLSLAWVWSNPEVSVALVGSKRREQLEEVARAAELVLPPEVKKELDLISEQVTPAFLKA